MVTLLLKVTGIIHSTDKQISIFKSLICEAYSIYLINYQRNKSEKLHGSAENQDFTGIIPAGNLFYFTYFRITRRQALLCYTV